MASKIKAPTLDELTAQAYPKRPEDIQAPELNINPEPAEPKAPEYPTVTSMTDLVDKLNPYQPPTPEQLEAEKKRERSKSTISAISDGLSALANIYATSQGAAPQQLSSLSGANAQRRKAMLDKRQQLIDAKLRQTVQAKQQDDANALHKYSAETSAYNTNRAFETNKANRLEDVTYRTDQAEKAHAIQLGQLGVSQKNATTAATRAGAYDKNAEASRKRAEAALIKAGNAAAEKTIGKYIPITYTGADGKEARADIPEGAILSAKVQLAELLKNDPNFMAGDSRSQKNEREALFKSIDQGDMTDKAFIQLITSNAAKMPAVLKYLKEITPNFVNQVIMTAKEETEANLDELGFEPDVQGNELPQTSEMW